MRSPSDLVVEAVQALSALEQRIGALERALAQHSPMLSQVQRDLALLSRDVQTMSDQVRREQDRADRTEELALQHSHARWAGLQAALARAWASPWVQAVLVLALAGWLGVSLDRVLALLAPASGVGVSP